MYSNTDLETAFETSNECRRIIDGLYEAYDISRDAYNENKRKNCKTLFSDTKIAKGIYDAIEYYRGFANHLAVISIKKYIHQPYMSI